MPGSFSGGGVGSTGGVVVGVVVGGAVGVVVFPHRVTPHAFCFVRTWIVEKKTRRKEETKETKETKKRNKEKKKNKWNSYRRNRTATDRLNIGAGTTVIVIKSKMCKKRWIMRMRIRRILMIGESLLQLMQHSYAARCDEHLDAHVFGIPSAISVHLPKQSSKSFIEIK